MVGDPGEWLSEYKRQMLSAMVEAGINSQEKINRGLSKARKLAKPWLPNPGEFCQWCKPGLEDYGLPGAAVAFDDARNQAGKPPGYRHWLHEAVYLAAVDTGFFDLKSVANNSGNYQSVKARFEEKYSAYVQRVIDGEQLSVPEDQRITHQATDRNNPRHKRAGEKTLSRLRGFLDE